MRPPARATIPILLLVSALALLAPVANAAERTVAVTASATLKVPNDTAALGFSVSREKRTQGAALRAVSKGLRRVIAAAQATPGVGAGDVTTGRISVREARRGERVIYRAAQGIAVTLHEPDKAGELVGAAIGAGATGVSGPRFFVGDTESAFTRALTAAFDKAKTRAGALATQAGAGLGPVVTIDEGSGPELTPQFKSVSAPAADCVPATSTPGPIRRRCAASPPTRPGTSTVTATVRVVFSLQ